MRSRRMFLWIGAGVIALALVIALFHRPEKIGIDFHTYEAAAQVGLQQGWAHIYDQAAVAVAQNRLAPTDWSQPFLSPPTVAWLAAALAPFPYALAYGIWAVVGFAAFAVALAWSAESRGLMRWIGAGAALAPWWVLHAVSLGQVVPFVAAGVVVAWRLLRDERDVAAGLALAVIFLKPNTAILVPIVLLAAGRYRAVVAWVAAGILLGAIAAVTLGPHGLSAYVAQLRAPLPTGADALTLKGAVGADGAVGLALRVIIIGAVLATAFRMRKAQGLVIPIGIVVSLLVSPYLHASDLCLLAAAAWMAWEERPAPVWRAPLAVGWVLASPFLFVNGLSPGLNRWPLLELILLGGIIAAAWRPLTGSADLRTRAPA
jgi:alpha-1,2-mannosyltransferase